MFVSLFYCLLHYYATQILIFLRIIYIQYLTLEFLAGLPKVICEKSNSTSFQVNQTFNTEKRLISVNGFSSEFKNGNIREVITSHFSLLMNCYILFNVTALFYLDVCLFAWWFAPNLTTKDRQKISGFFLCSKLSEVLSLVVVC